MKEASGLTIDGQGAEIVCHDFATLFEFVNCRNLTIRNLKIDYDPLPLPPDKSSATGDGYADLQLAKSEHPMQAGFRAESLLSHDPVWQRMGLMKDDLYQPNLEKRTEQIGPDILRVPVTRQLFKTGALGYSPPPDLQQKRV